MDHESAEEHDRALDGGSHAGDELECSLPDACARWQSGRNIGSSLLRGAARVLTGIPHYFRAPFIERYENDAREHPRSLACARVLLDAIANSTRQDPSDWHPGASIAARGLEKQEKWIDDQILDSLRAGSISMPLWGVSLDRAVAEGFGDRFLFVIKGPFHGVAAWKETQDQEESMEVITGGHYEVLTPPEVLGGDGTIEVKVREVGPTWPVG